MASTAPRLETAASREATSRAPFQGTHADQEQKGKKKRKKREEAKKGEEQEAKRTIYLASSYLPIRISKSQPEIEV